MVNRYGSLGRPFCDVRFVRHDRSAPHGLSAALLALTAVAAGLLVPERSAADCIDYEKYIHPMGGVGAPECLGYSVAVSGTHACVVGWEEGGFYVIDVSNPDHPVLDGSLDVPGAHLWAVAALEDYAYVTEIGGFDLRVIDVSDPGHPHVVGSVGLSDMALGVAVSGIHAYVGAYAGGLVVVDVSDPELPRIVGRYDTPGQAIGVAVWGDYAYVADYETGLLVINVSDPENPQLVGTADTPGLAWVVSVSGTIAFVGEHEEYSYDASLCVIDVSDPSRPRLLGSIEPLGYSASIFSVVAVGPFAYFTTGYGLHVLDATDPEDLSVIGEFAFQPDYIFLGVAVAPTASADGSFVYGSGGRLYDPMTSTGWFQIIDVSSLDQPEPLSNINVTRYATDISVKESHAYIVNAVGLEVVDVADPHNPKIVGAVDTPSYAVDVAVAGRCAYVAGRSSGLQAVDVTDPRNPRIVGSVDTPGTALGVAACGRYAYVADEAAGLHVIDVRNPQSPIIVGSVDTPGSAHGVVVSNGCAYVADWVAGLQVIDVVDPSNPVLIGSLDTPGYASGLAVCGDYAFVSAGDDQGLQVIDVGDPTAPWLVSSMHVLVGVADMVATRHHVYLVSPYVGLQVVDVSDPERPRNVGNGNMWRYAKGVDVSGSFVFVVDADSWEQVSSLSIFPSQCEPMTTPRYGAAVALSGVRVSAFPNPIIGDAVMQLSVPTPGPVRAKIWDVSGRLVRSLHDGILPVGPQELYWDGRDQEGRSVAAGIYWLRITTGEGSTSERLVVLR